MRQFLRRLIVITSACIVALMLLFPPWQQELFSVIDPNGHDPKDLRPLTEQELLKLFGRVPSPPQVFRRSIFYRPADGHSSSAEGGTVTVTYRIAWRVLATEFAVLAIISAGAFVLLWERRRRLA